MDSYNRKKEKSTLGVKKTLVVSDTPESVEAKTMPRKNNATQRNYIYERLKSAASMFETTVDGKNAKTKEYIEKLDKVATTSSKADKEFLDNVEARHSMKWLLSSVYLQDLSSVMNGNGEKLAIALGKCVEWLTVDEIFTDDSVTWWAFNIGSTIVNWSDKDKTFCKIAVFEAEALLTWIHQVVKSSKLKELAENDREAMKLLEHYLGTLHNISRVSENRPKLTELKIVDSLDYYLSCSVPVQRCLAMILMASIVEDDESAKISDKYGVITTLTKILSEAIKDDGRIYKGFCVEELLHGANLIMVNEENKSKFAAAGILPILDDVLQSGSSLEKSAAVECIWTLSFGDAERKQILAIPSINESMQKISKSDSDKGLRVKTSRALDFVSNGKSNLSKLSHSSDEEKSGKTTEEHVFISYCWENQETCKQIRDFLKSQGVKVEMDIDNMSGSTLDYMAKAIEKAKAILVCYSDSYKQSPNCRTEAEYVFQLRKPFVPVNMQRRYRPDGWLGLIIGARFYIDMSLVKTPFSEASQNLHKELNNILGLGDSKDEPKTEQPSFHSEAKIIEPKQATSSGSQNPVVTGLLPPGPGKKLLSVSFVRSKIGQWSTADVDKWLGDQSLKKSKSIVSLFNGMNGRHLAVIYEMKVLAADIFYSSLLKSFEGALADVLKLSEALERLPTAAAADKL